MCVYICAPMHDCEVLVKVKIKANEKRNVSIFVFINIVLAVIAQLHTN